MKLERQFKDIRFSPEVLQEALFALPCPSGQRLILRPGSVTSADSTWTFDDIEEFYAEYRRFPEMAHLIAGVFCEDDNLGLGVSYADFALSVSGRQTSVEVTAPERGQIEKVFSPLEAKRKDSALPVEPLRAPIPPTIFIGHGRSLQWRDLKDHLREQHGYAIQAYEVGARAGHTIRDILQEMLQSSTFAVLVMTAEDVTADGELRARENVVHEAGLFQGRLGFSRAIVLVEEGIDPFSNLQGVQQIRYRNGNIRETFGDVLGTLRREFG